MSFQNIKTRSSLRSIASLVLLAICLLPAHLLAQGSYAAPQLEIAAGNTYSLFLKDGAVWATGRNADGQFGSGSSVDTSTPVQVPGLSDVSAIAGSLNHSLFLKSDGTVWATGRNDLGQLGDGTIINRTVPVQVIGLTDVSAIAAGWNHSLFLKNDGTVWATGSNVYGELGDGTNTQRIFPVQVSGLTNVTAIAAAGWHSLFLQSDETAWATGRSDRGQLGIGTTVNTSTAIQVTTGVSAIAAGLRQSLFLKTDGTVRASGKNLSGQLGDGTTTDRHTPVQVSGLIDIIAITGGDDHSLFLKADGTVWGTGSNSLGQLGDGTTSSTNIPVQGMAEVSAISSAGSHSLFLKIDGTAWASGFNSSGQLGDGTLVNKSTPVQVTDLLGDAQMPAPLLYYDFEEGTGSSLNDGSGNSNDGAIQRGVTFVTGAPSSSSAGTAGLFSNGRVDISSVDVPTALADRVTNQDGSYTLAAWIKPDASSLTGEHFLFGQDFQGIHNGIRPNIGGDGALSTAHWGSDFAATTALIADQWVHAVWTYDGSTDTARIYLNGVLDGGPFSQLAPTGTGTLILGCRNGDAGGEDPFNGSVDDIAVWDKVISDPAIQALAVGSSPNARDITASYTTGSEVPLSISGYTATGSTVSLALNYAPVAGTNLTVLENTGPEAIQGSFDNLPDGARVDLSFGGSIYHFLASYSGGDGNDLVLLWVDLVANTNDFGAGSLRATIANSVSGDVIGFDPNLSGQTITLGSEMTLDKDLTITGSGLAGGISISGNNASRIFVIPAGVTVNLTSLILRNGKASDGGNGGNFSDGASGSHGGAIHNSGTLTLNACNLLSSAAGHGGTGGSLYSGGGGDGSDGGDGGDGGGIYNSAAGVLELISCTLDGNEAGNGGHGGRGDRGDENSSRDSDPGGDGGDAGDGGHGGGIYNAGVLELVSCTLDGNEAGSGGQGGAGGEGGEGGNYAEAGDAGDGGDGGYGAVGGHGGGIYNSGVLELVSGTLVGNEAGNSGNGGIGGRGGSGGNYGDAGVGGYGGNGVDGGDGGGIQNAASGVLELISCTLDGNAAGQGGYGGSLGWSPEGGGESGFNSYTGGGGLGGAINNRGTMSLSACTVTANAAGIGGYRYPEEPSSGGNGGGISNGGTANLYSSLVALNSVSTGGSSPDVSGVVISQGNNLVGVSDGSSGWDIFIGDFTGSAATPIDPLLALLGHYGGFTHTRPPLAGSPVVDATSVPGSLTATDQRGFPRVIDGDRSGLAKADIGAVESLTGADLSSLDFTGLNLINIDLSETNLSGTNLAGTDLTGVRSGAIIGTPSALPAGWLIRGGYLLGSGANLSGTDLSGVDLSGADLTGADLSGVRSDLVTGSPTALPDGWSLSGGYLLGPGADLSGIDLSGVDLSGVDLAGANLTGVRSGGITGTPANLPGGWLLNGGYLLGPGADLSGADLSGMNLSGTDFNNSNLAGADLIGAYVVVDTIVDESNTPALGGFGISLREALRDAAPGIEIRFDAALDEGVIVLNGSQILIEKDVSIDASSLAGGITVSGDNRSRVFVIDAGITVNLIAMNIRNGLAPTGQTGEAGVVSTSSVSSTGGVGAQGAHGGGIHNSGTLTVTVCTIVDNRAGKGGTGGDGGVVSTSSDLASGGNGGLGGSGGGIYNVGVLELIQCTVSGNDSGAGGNRGSLGDVGVTPVAGSIGPGGGLHNAGGGMMNLTSCTVSGNTAAYGGGILSTGSTTLGNTLVAENASTVLGAGPDISGALISAGYNLFGIDTGSTITGDLTGNQVGTELAPIDPLLGLLADNGGPTLTMALPRGSPALDIGNPALTGTDQRGKIRPSRAGVDIGAYEALPFSAGLVVEQPTDTPQISGADFDHGFKVLGSVNDLTFTIRNSGDNVTVPLTGISVIFVGDDEDEFSITPTPPSQLVGGTSATFTLRFTPTVHGSKSVVMQILSSDPDEPSFELNFMAHGYRAGDTDGDGLSNFDELTVHFTDPDLADEDDDGANDGAEIGLASLGFVNGTDNSALVALLKTNSTGLGLYDENNIQDLALGQPLIQRDAATGKVTLEFQIQQSPDFSTPWTPVQSITPTFNDTTKEIEAEFDPPAGSTYFFRLYGSE